MHKNRLIGAVLMVLSLWLNEVAGLTQDKQIYHFDISDKKDLDRPTFSTTSSTIYSKIFGSSTTPLSTSTTVSKKASKLTPTPAPTSAQSTVYEKSTTRMHRSTTIKPKPHFNTTISKSTGAPTKTTGQSSSTQPHSTASGSTTGATSHVTKSPTPGSSTKTTGATSHVTRSPTPGSSTTGAKSHVTRSPTPRSSTKPHRTTPPLTSAKTEPTQPTEKPAPPIPTGVIAAIVIAVLAICVVLFVAGLGCWLLWKRGQLCVMSSSPVRQRPKGRSQSDKNVSIEVDTLPARPNSFVLPIDHDTISRKKGSPNPNRKRLCGLCLVFKQPHFFLPLVVRIQLKDFHARVQHMHRDNDFMFQAEFERLDEISRNLPHIRESLVAMQDLNIGKNRFIDILPFSETRVKLDDTNGNSDYINASYIHGYKKGREYIATQAPIGPEETENGRRTSTVVDFWNMIWELEVSCVVMLCQCVEQFRVKCAVYWPGFVNEVSEFGDYKITLISNTDKNSYIVRKLLVEKKKHSDEVRYLTQWHFLNWQDMRQTALDDLLQFVEHIRYSGAINGAAPAVVHCSAGVGRTGTFVALDCLLQYIRDYDYVDVMGCVHTLRSQRIRMVQTLEQYIQLYDALDVAILKKLSRPKLTIQDKSTHYENFAFHHDRPESLALENFVPEVRLVLNSLPRTSLDNADSPRVSATADSDSQSGKGRPVSTSRSSAGSDV